MGWPRDLDAKIRKIIVEETKYLRHYKGKVVDVGDPLKSGRVLAQIPDLGWDTNDKAAWCWPSQLHAQVTPKVGEWVEVYFDEGDRNSARYISLAGDMTGTKPAAFDGDQKTAVIFQDPETGDAIVYDGTDFKIMGSGDNLVKYSALAQAFTNLKSVFDSHVHAPGLLVTTCPAGAGTVSGGTTAAPSSTMSDDISGAKVEHLKTD